MSKRAANLAKPTARDREIIIDNFLIEEGILCPRCKDLDCARFAAQQND
jgi:hypothetical protein